MQKEQFKRAMRLWLGGTDEKDERKIEKAYRMNRREINHLPPRADRDYSVSQVRQKLKEIMDYCKEKNILTLKEYLDVASRPH